MKVLVTGSNGYLGSVLQKEFKNHPEYSVIYTDLGLFEGTNYIKCNLAKDNLAEKFEKPDAIIHLAGISNDPASELDPQLTYDMNIAASKNIIDYATNHNVDKFIFASSASVYGRSFTPSLEDSTLNPQSLYAESKIKIEEYLTKSTALPVILRFGTLFGVSPKMRFDLVINIMVKDVLTKGKISVFGGNQYRPFLYVRDAARACIHGLASTQPVTVNIAYDNAKIFNLANQIQDITFSDLEVIESSVDNRHYSLNLEKMRTTFGFIPRNSIEIGTKRLLTYVQSMINSGINLNRDEFYTIRMWKNYYKENYEHTI